MPRHSPVRQHSTRRTTHPPDGDHDMPGGPAAPAVDAHNAGMSTADRITAMVILMERLLRTNSGADNKVATIMGMNTTMLAVLAALVTRQTVLSFWLILLSSLSALGLLLGLFFLSLSSLPRTSHPSRSVVFFGAIAATDAQVFSAQVKSLTNEEYLDDLIDQCYRTSLIATQKFSWIRRAQMAWYASILPWLLAVYTLYQT